MDWEELAAVMASIIASASPLVYAVVGETISEKAGVVNLSLDGSIALSAMSAFAISYLTGSAWLGFLAAIAVSALIAALIAFASIELRLNQIAVGFVLFLLAASLASFLGDPLRGVVAARVEPMPIPGLSAIPGVGKILFDHNLSVYGSYVALIAAYVFLYKTRRGLELQGVGERPEAAFARGVPVNRLRYLYTIVGGAFVGLAGAAFSLHVKLGWSDGLTNFGWIALAIVIFGGWNPVRAALGCYLFGALQWAALELQPVWPNLSQVLPMMPFVLMIFMLLLVYTDWFRRIGDDHPSLRRFLASDPPSGIGIAFRRE